MKPVTLSILCLLSAALSAADLALPAPRKSGGMTLAEALNTRHTVRRFAERQVTLPELSAVLWMANGVNRPDGKRTAPSARNRQEIMIYVTTADGTYLYDAPAHALKEVTKTDLRAAAGGFPAPCYLILVADTRKQTQRDFALIDSGYVSQNIYLAARSLGLGTCAMARIADRDTLRRELALGENLLLLVHPLGTPAK
ncbi:MAG: SagB/ThcOx family dehydrogenase [Lentisphaeria bacterium]|nr:SagB/ThcOx family dehydrogenase [Lentisphaeria bacterium]